MNRQVYSVSSLNRYVKQLLDNDINVTSILVKGEVSNFTNHRSGHWYFSLKDRTAKISCVMFASYASRSKLLLKEGMQVIVHASLSMYEAQGSCQLFVTSVQMDGLGDLYLELEQVKEKLRLEGYFLEEHKQKLPLFPMSIAVITAKTGAAVQDILSTIARRWPIANVKIYPTLVQGRQAMAAIIDNLHKADEKKYDVILLARGGGSIEDLWCFNEEALARCIYDMKTPIVTGVGHETDTTLVDYVSDARAPTPTAAAELITPDIQEVRMQMRKYQRALETEMQYLLEQQRIHLLQIMKNRYLQDPLLYVQQHRMHLAMQSKSMDQHLLRISQKKIYFHSLSQRLSSMMDTRRQVLRHDFHMKELRLYQQIALIQNRNRQQLQEKAMLLDALSPLKILARGYSIAYKDEKIISSVDDIQKDDSLKLQLRDGIAKVLVQDVKGK